MVGQIIGWAVIIFFGVWTLIGLLGALSKKEDNIYNGFGPVEKGQAPEQTLKGLTNQVGFLTRDLKEWRRKYDWYSMWAAIATCFGMAGIIKPYITGFLLGIPVAGGIHFLLNYYLEKRFEKENKN